MALHTDLNEALVTVSIQSSCSARKGKLKSVGGRWAENEGESVADFVRREREQVMGGCWSAWEYDLYLYWI